MRNVAGKQDEPEAIGLSESGFLDLVKNDELLAQESILGDELWYASGQVGGRGMCRGSRLGRDSPSRSRWVPESSR